ncbi:MAG TPA: ABC transporter substrate-binding protein, partial [Stellaceae bacterium]|nr:ABC transporter substrate-binding protein [Stellaceae bacterium]
MGRAWVLVGLLLLCPAMDALARPPDELAIGITQFPNTLNPLIDALVAKNYVLAMVRRPLTAYDPEWQLQCMLCVELPSLEKGTAVALDLGHGKRGVRLTYRLEAEARWGDGVPVTTRDVLFTYEVGRAAKSGVASGELYRRITAIHAIDEKSFTIELDRLTFDYAALGDFELLPAHLEEDAFRDPERYRLRTLYDRDPTNPGLYFGPYKITELVQGSHIVLERNPTWWGPRPYFRRITIFAVENTVALEANLLAGSIDMVAGELGFSLDQALGFEARHGKDFTILYKPGLTYEHIDLNLDHPILKDRRVRQALL